MAEPLSWRAIQAVAALLSRIRIVDGWYTDLGAITPILDRTQIVEANTAHVVILAGEIDLSGSTRRATASGVDLTIEFAAPRLPGTHPELLAHRGLADLARALATDLRGEVLGFTALDLISARIVGASESGSNLVIAQVSARAAMSEPRNPATP